MANIYFETYGCQMNLSEASSLSDKAKARGHKIVDNPENAHFVIINTCSVRLTAEERIEGRLGFYRALNRSLDHDLKVILMGCMSENIGLDVQKRFADIVSIVWGTYNKDAVIDYLDDLDARTESLGFGAAYSFMPATPSKEFPFKAFLPVSHGCNKHCSYCIVPHVRGLEQNRPFQDIVDNAKKLAADGVIELCLLGQTIDTYCYENKRLPDLLEAVASQAGIQRITFLTAHPKEFLYETVELMNAYPNIMPYLHLPFQAGSNRVLRLMKRGYTRELYLEKIARIREIRPDIILSTDIIVGFPSETEQEFEETMDLFTEIRFNEAFMYRYNTRPNTPAEHFEGQVPEKEKLRRLDILVKKHRQILAEELLKHQGCEYTILFDRESKYSLKSESGIKQYVGRTHNNLMCATLSAWDLIGKLARVRIQETRGAITIGELV
ncbi:tRNA-2-methylthio-N6-dimethylallyladenosine synthase [Brevinema andersonii]|uniref:tRNA-2-methylthio-N(6)-dimethylallyladenosine synthase n=1 Tax=Brevinema andersonii TaxID=34097 RepID=A0A1I1E584_BREAD|nr:tRNA (N6-isopentenyl adenosine(37)-C2)-methylthiotransferase MiaB [Brevinema andersonii]SFB80023.1 tRNA-2-methylthio-N6-dimethylallyladenosine synthase [Brevinema andersonii]